MITYVLRGVGVRWRVCMCWCACVCVHVHMCLRDVSVRCDFLYVCLFVWCAIVCEVCNCVCVWGGGGGGG